MERTHVRLRQLRRPTHENEEDKVDERIEERIKAAIEKYENIKKEVLAMKARLVVMTAHDKEAVRLQQLAQMEGKIDYLYHQLANEEAMKATLTEAVRTLLTQLLQAQEALNRGIDPRFLPTAQEKLAARKKLRCKEGYFHIAIAGRSGTGKSSLINAIRGLKNSDPRAAAVGYTETTLEIARYESADPRDSLVWYDVPGAGTLNIDRWEYFKDQCLYMFDAIILAWDTRFMDTDVAILMHCQNLKIPCFVVRSKCDVELKNIRRDIQDELDLESSDSESTSKMSRRYREEVETFRRRNQEIVNETCRKQHLHFQEVYLINARAIYQLVSRTDLRLGQPNSSMIKLDEGRLVTVVNKEWITQKYRWLQSKTCNMRLEAGGSSKAWASEASESGLRTALGDVEKTGASVVS